MISLETHIPLVLNSQIIQPPLLQKLLGSDTFLAAYNCNVNVVNNTTTPQKVLQCYLTCLKESVTAVREGGSLQVDS